MKGNEIVKELRLSENPIGRNGGYALAEMMEINGSLQVRRGCEERSDDEIHASTILYTNSSPPSPPTPLPSASTAAAAPSPPTTSSP